jgi:hypothetical protein
VNAGKEPVDAEFELPAGMKAEEIHVLFEKRKLAAGSGTFKDRFAPYGVHVYATSPDLPD